MKSQPKYTIAIPAYKSRFLADCIESVLQQDFSDFELLIVNDASPDPIEPLIAKYSDERIRYYVNNTNRGSEHLVDNWNKCLHLASGRYFVLLGDDDFLDPDFLTSFEELMEDFPGLQVYHCRSKIVDAESNVVDLTPPWPSYETVYDNLYYRLSMSRIQYISDFVYETSGLRTRGGFYKLPLAWGSDDITAFMACSVAGIAHTNKPVFNYRESAITVTRSGNVHVKMQAVQEQGQWLSSFLSSAPVHPLERLRYQQLKHSLKDFMLMKKADLIKIDLHSGGLRALLYWLKSASTYHIHRGLILRLYLSTLREKSKTNEGGR